LFFLIDPRSRFFIDPRFFYRSALAIYIVRASAPLAALSTICSSLHHTPHQHQPKLNNATRHAPLHLQWTLHAVCALSRPALHPHKLLL
jgi:hypothetical protein